MVWVRFFVSHQGAKAQSAGKVVGSGQQERGALRDACYSLPAARHFIMIHSFGNF
jgi:hypothetical protein